MSITQSTNYLAFAGVIVILLKYAGVEVAEADIQTLIGAVLTIVGIVSNFVHRYNKGDVTVVGNAK
jgi:hypothetical protein